jgi:hypothetical protein
MSLGNSNQLNVGHISAGDLRRLCDLILNAVKVCFDITHGFHSEQSQRRNFSSLPIVAPVDLGIASVFLATAIELFAPTDIAQPLNDYSQFRYFQFRGFPWVILAMAVSNCFERVLLG